MIKKINDIWQEHNNNSSSLEYLNDLIYHIENDEKPENAITIATDMIVDKPNNSTLQKLIPHIVKQLDSNDDFIREITVGCIIARMKLIEYAEKALDMSMNDPYDNVRGLAAMSLGAVINDLEHVLRNRIAEYLYGSMFTTDHNDWHKECVFYAIMEAMDVPLNNQTKDKIHFSTLTPEQNQILEKFRIKYGLGKVNIK